MNQSHGLTHGLTDDLTVPKKKHSAKTKDEIPTILGEDDFGFYDGLG